MTSDTLTFDELMSVAKKMLSAARDRHALLLNEKQVLDAKLRTSSDEVSRLLKMVGDDDYEDGPIWGDDEPYDD